MYYFMPPKVAKPPGLFLPTVDHSLGARSSCISGWVRTLVVYSLPNWAQSLSGWCFHADLPSWGAGDQWSDTHGAWDRVRDDVILKFMVVAVTAYGMATLKARCCRCRKT